MSAQPPQVLPELPGTEHQDPILSEPPLPPGLASYLGQCGRSMCPLLSSPCPRCHPGPGAPCAHCPTPSEHPGQLEAVLSLSHPRCWVSSTPFSHVSLVSAALRPRGSWPLPSASAPTLCRPVPCHTEERAGLGEERTIPLATTPPNTQQGILLYLLCPSRHSLPSLHSARPPVPKKMSSSSPQTHCVCGAWNSWPET